MIKLFPCILFSKLQIKLVCLLFLLVDCWGSAKVYVDENITGKRNILIQIYMCSDLGKSYSSSNAIMLRIFNNNYVCKFCVLVYVTNNTYISIYECAKDNVYIYIYFFRSQI